MWKHLLTLMVCCSSLACAAPRPAAQLKHAASPEEAKRAQPRSPGATVNAETPTTTAPDGGYDEAHGLVIGALACWEGALWSDAQGVPKVERADVDHRRCRQLLQRAYGHDDPVRYERLRALDEQEVAALRDHIAGLARQNPDASARASELLQLFGAIADLERETLYARRAADKVKQDIDLAKPADKRHADEAAAKAPVGRADAFIALARLSLTELKPEADAVLLINAMERAQLARGLPRPLQLDAVDEPYALLFGVAPKVHQPDPNHALQPGVWLVYLSEVAAAAGHPVPAAAHSLRDRELLAWGGVGMGFADRLSARAQAITEKTELKSVAQAIVRRLEAQYHDDQAALSQPAHAAK